MNILIVLIPVSITLGAAGLAACIWTLRHGQYEDLEGDAARILLDDREPDEPQ
ncbi:cbb3-type cytochrome oxidase assembly protein CcoS [Pontivivens nitratireducens]|jgi:cbb3-type cytochrome oxidase maturation protein|uniref:Cbb3-type cytochrome oxidase assembly protein CcoS n=1 Tax=Pontivivens nitratireducens TaxID=2758038 RepID=A0A6G7VKI2_9RHOB|nr:cbb3-type cytochrome oxidase assembly protein CcoS [Pontibrevibacter nitratireducens]QIK40531.1 cbb3-type cytochrome oxidase assembly protein CcoS [Pontibrevibacter nitratireducens]